MIFRTPYRKSNDLPELNAGEFLAGGRRRLGFVPRPPFLQCRGRGRRRRLRGRAGSQDPVAQKRIVPDQAAILVFFVEASNPLVGRQKGIRLVSRVPQRETRRCDEHEP